MSFNMKIDCPWPRKKTKDAAAYDVYSPTDFSIPAGSLVSVDLGFTLTQPQGVIVRLNSRSSLALKRVHCFNGIIDPGKKILTHSIPSKIYIVLETDTGMISTRSVPIE